MLPRQLFRSATAMLIGIADAVAGLKDCKYTLGTPWDPRSFMQTGAFDAACAGSAYCSAYAETGGAPPRPMACNGYEQLCDRTLANITLGLGANPIQEDPQIGGIRGQLLAKMGVSGFVLRTVVSDSGRAALCAWEFDRKYSSGTTWTCRDHLSVITEVISFLQDVPNALVVLIYLDSTGGSWIPDIEREVRSLPAIDGRPCVGHHPHRKFPLLPYFAAVRCEISRGGSALCWIV
jgi:hypothetical protein